MSTQVFNDVEFKTEDAIAALLATALTDAALVGAPLHKSLVNDALETSHTAIIADSCLESDGHPRNGNWRIDVRVKSVTSIDEVLPVGFADLRTLHRTRCGLLRDALMQADIDAQLSAALANYTVQGFTFGPIHQRIVGRSWVTEFTVVLQSVCGSDL